MEILKDRYWELSVLSLSTSKASLSYAYQFYVTLTPNCKSETPAALPFSGKEGRGFSRSHHYYESPTRFWTVP